MLRASSLPPVHYVITTGTSSATASNTATASASYHATSHMISAAKNHQYSHWNAHDAEEVRRQCFPKAKTVLAYGGLQMIPPRVGPRGSKEPQFKIFQNDLKRYSGEVCVLMALSNDFDKIILRNGKPLELQREAINKWNKFDKIDMQDFEYKHQNFLKTTAEKFLKNKLDEYLNILCNLLKNTKAEVFVHTSVLERQYSNIDKSHLDILWASLNSLLHEKLKKLTIHNINGKLISIKFISLTWQYHSNETFIDFRENEWNAWIAELKNPGSRAKRNLPPAHLTHRNQEAYLKLFKYINDKVEVYVNQLNCLDS